MVENKNPENILILDTTKGRVVIELFAGLAPGHVTRIKELVREGAYDNVIFHRVIDGFMAQTGDVQFGKKDGEKFNLSRAGMGGSEKPDLAAEFSNLSHKRGTVSMARSQNPNSANSQFFICFADAPWLDRQYSIWGKVVEGMENVDKIKRGEPVVDDPDTITKAVIAADAE
ncbi:peptidylprolyl isomerase [Bartonella sp. MM73XJBT.G]|uniref:peptidylprolyl isomerase n=1 Tax=Bartonella sp. MM73XJBT.G TaxID=3019097 RepID=UPI002361DCF7|nr:peptidylprolyl isomerase [Bartonella sp. MM73XJBT.G]